MNETLEPAGERKEPRSAGKLRILIVEDDAETAESLAVLLHRHHYDVSVAADGAAAVEMARAHNPDVVLLDIGLPEMDGWEVAKRLRDPLSWPEGKRPMLVAISGYGQEADRQRSMEAGIDLHLVKPADPDWLGWFLERFRSVLEP
jgi:CheY-like chemotaxis protein